MWRQRSRLEWLKEVDQNTRFFHCKANQRNKRNYIVGLEDDSSPWQMEESRMRKIIEEYFVTLFTTSVPSGFDEILCGIQPSIMDEMNATFTCEFTLEEVHQALKQMAPTTALGPDDMSPIFYKSFWKIMGDDVTKIVLNALKTGVVHESLNATFISLIPKIKNPK